MEVTLICAALQAGTLQLQKGDMQLETSDIMHAEALRSMLKQYAYIASHNMEPDCIGSIDF